MTQTKRGIQKPKQKKDALLDKMKPVIKVLGPYLFLEARNQNWSFVPEADRSAIKIVVAEISICTAAFIQMHSIYSDMLLTLEISKRFPWRKGRPISRAQHLGFGWLQHVNLCYMFRERYKLSANRVNHLMSICQRPYRANVGVGLKNIDRGLGRFIRSRGRHVHEWDVHDERIRILSFAELVHKFGEVIPAEIGDQTKHYLIARNFVISDIKKALLFVERFLIESIDGYMSEVVSLVAHFDNVLNQMKNEPLR